MIRTSCTSNVKILKPYMTVGRCLGWKGSPAGIGLKSVDVNRAISNNCTLGITTCTTKKENLLHHTIQDYCIVFVFHQLLVHTFHSCISILTHSFAIGSVLAKFSTSSNLRGMYVISCVPLAPSVLLELINAIILDGVM